MNCKNAEQQIELFRENSLSGQLESDLRDHLSECRACRQLLTSLDALDSDLKAALEGKAPSANLGARVSEAVADLDTGHKQSIHLVWLRPALAAGLVASLGILWLRNYDPSPATAGDPLLAKMQKFEPAADSQDGVGKAFVIGEDSVAEYTGQATVRVIRSSTRPLTLIVDAFPEELVEEKES